MKLNKCVFASALLVFASTAPAAGVEVLLGHSVAKKNSPAYTLDILSDGTVSAFQFDIDFPGVPTKAVDLSKCGGGLAKKHGFELSCAWVEGKVRVVGYSATLQKLPEGWHNLGAVRVSGAKNASAQVSGLLAGDSEGREIVSSSKVESLD